MLIKKPPPYMLDVNVDVNEKAPLKNWTLMLMLIKDPPPKYSPLMLILKHPTQIFDVNVNENAPPPTHPKCWTLMLMATKDSPPQTFDVNVTVNE